MAIQSINFHLQFEWLTEIEEAEGERKEQQGVSEAHFSWILTGNFSY